MTDLSISELLHAYGNWVRSDSTNLGCKSPSLMLIKTAPHLCSKDSVKPSSRRTVSYISDEDALAIDRAMNKLLRHSVHLHNIVTYHFIYNWSERKIARDYWSDFEYPNSEKQAGVYHVKPLLNLGIGFVSGVLARDIA